ncbi:MAG: hypothetical protein IK001_08330 [Lachnospiraceae bacterium]|nr:hypothetical protein [Lachnospiraceae bacterium]
MRELNEKDKTTLQEDAAIYGKRDERGAFEKFRSLTGAAKWEFFRDYFLWKLVAIAAGVAALVLLLVQILGPQEEIVCNIAVLDDPFTQAAYDIYETKLNEAFITDEKLQRVTLDTSYYVTSDGYNSRTKLMTYIAASEIDFMILPVAELTGYLESGMFADLEPLLSADTRNMLGELLTYRPTYHDDDDPSAGPAADTTTCYAVNITEALNKMNGYDLMTQYYMVCVVNAKHPDKFETAVSLLLTN